MSKRTSAEEIRQRLADHIITGVLVPGAPLDETQLASDFAVSRTPVREALRLLAASGLVDQRPHARAIVARPDAAALASMFEVMAHLEALSAGLAAEAMEAGERRALDTLHERMARIVHEGDAAGYTAANEAFHSSLYDGAHNAYLAEITRATRLRLRPFRQAQFAAPGRLARSHAEHERIVSAILRGDRAAAETATREHISLVEGAYRGMARAAN